MPRIIISYRRADADSFAGRVRDRIASRYGEDSVFIDVDNIPLGKDFRVHIQEVMAKADAVLVIIGPKWLGPVKGGQSRIMNATDPCRIEVETALEKKKLTIPVLVGRTAMPTQEQLPESLKDFPFLNGAPVDTGRDFHRDLTRVIASLNENFHFDLNTAERAAIADDAPPGPAVKEPAPATDDAARASAPMSHVQPMGIYASPRAGGRDEGIDAGAMRKSSAGRPAVLAAIAGAGVIAAGALWLSLSPDKDTAPRPSNGASKPDTTIIAAAPPPVMAAKPAAPVPTAPAPVPGNASAPAIPDQGAAVVTAFFNDLGRGDGAAAAALVVPEKRKDNYDPQKMTATYSKFSTPLKLQSVVASGPNTYRVAYTYQTSPANAPCSTTATVGVTERNGQYFVQYIQASC